MLTFVSFSGLFFEKHLKYIKLSESAVQFSKRDLSYLLKDNYDKTFMKEVYQTPVVTFEELRRGMVNSKGPVRIQYNNRNQYKGAAKSLGIMDDFKVKLIICNNQSSTLTSFILFSERRASNSLQRCRLVVLQQPASVPGAEYQLERLRPLMELTG